MLIILAVVGYLVVGFIFATAQAVIVNSNDALASGTLILFWPVLAAILLFAVVVFIVIAMPGTVVLKLRDLIRRKPNGL